jgi:hypothetical protein
MFLGTADRLDVVYIVNRSPSVADRASEYFVGRRINRKYVRPSTAIRDFAIDYWNDLV